MTILSNISKWFSVFPLTMDINDEFQSAIKFKSHSRQQFSVLTNMSTIGYCIDSSQWISTTFDVGISPNFLDVFFRVKIDSIEMKEFTTWDNSKHWRNNSFRPSLAARVSGVKPSLFRISVRAFFTGCRIAWLNISWKIPADVFFSSSSNCFLSSYRSITNDQHM